MVISGAINRSGPRLRVGRRGEEGLPLTKSDATATFGWRMEGKVPPKRRSEDASPKKYADEEEGRDEL